MAGHRPQRLYLYSILSTRLTIAADAEWLLGRLTMALCGVRRALRLEYCIEYVLVYRVVCTGREEER